MIEPITWRDEEGNIMTKATKAKLAKRLHRLGHFLWLFTSCRVQKSHISTTTKLMKSPHVAKNPTMLECFNDMITVHCQRYKDARDKLERMSRLTHELTGHQINYKSIINRIFHH